LCYYLVTGHPFVDGNKRTGYEAMRALLELNGLAVEASIDEAEALLYLLAQGDMDRAAFVAWVMERVRPSA
jgi:death on curing protein